MQQIFANVRFIVLLALIALGISVVSAGATFAADELPAELVQIVEDGETYVLTQGFNGYSFSPNTADTTMVNFAHGALASSLDFQSDVMGVLGNGYQTAAILTRNGLFDITLGADGLTIPNQGENRLPDGYTIFSAFTGNQDSVCFSVLVEQDSGIDLRGMSMVVNNPITLVEDMECAELPQNSRAAYVRLVALRNGVDISALEPVEMPTVEADEELEVECTHELPVGSVQNGNSEVLNTEFVYCVHDRVHFYTLIWSSTDSGWVVQEEGADTVLLTSSDSPFNMIYVDGDVAIWLKE
jgi:hypothetical protein